MKTASFQVSPQLHVFIDSPEGNRRLCLQSSTSESPLVVDDARLVWGLGQLADRIFTRAEAVELWARHEELATIAGDLWNFACSHQLIVDTSRGVGEYSIPAYHQATRDHPFLDMSRGPDSIVDDNRIMKTYLNEDDYPNVYLDLGLEPSLLLEDALDLDVAHLWTSKLLHYSFLLSGTFGQRRHVAPYYDKIYDCAQVELIYKSIPSGGSKHPTEAFLAVMQSDVIDSGVYHYDVRRNALCQVSDVLPVMPAGTLPRRVAASHEVTIVLYASVLKRAMWRYRESRSFRALLVDVGHAEGHLCTLASYAGWRYETLPLDSSVSSLVDILPLDAEQVPTLRVGLLSKG